MDKPTLRASQQEVLRYKSGKMGISAVPGAGKTWTLSQLAAKLILEKDLEPDQEILVVTFSNSAADNFASRIATFLGEAGLLEGIGYRVRTLHALANDILHERPEIAGLSESYTILDESEGIVLRNDLVNSYLDLNPDAFSGLFDPSLSAKKIAEHRQKRLPDLLNDLAIAYIRTAKDNQLGVEEMEAVLRNNPQQSELIEFGQQIYRDYQASLNYRGAVDFDDLIRLAMRCLVNDNDVLLQLRYRWPIILEDEAQDSSQLQQEILSLLTGDEGNWVRVGDPNQAIFESFTTANPNLLKRFLAMDDVLSLDLPESGRSSEPIIKLANTLSTWVQEAHPNMWVRDALSLPLIQPTKADDPQANPPTEPDALVLVQEKMNPQQEGKYLASKVKEYLEQHPDRTLAVLAYSNSRVAQLADEFRANHLNVVDALMKLPESTRLSAGTLSHMLSYIFQPLDAAKLGKVFTVFHRHEKEDPACWAKVERLSKLISSCDKVEDFLYPEARNDWLTLQESTLEDDEIADLGWFKQAVQSWLYYSRLPMDQLILLIVQDMNLDPFELATVHKVSLLIRDTQRTHPDWSAELLLEEIKKIARNERAFQTLSESEIGFDPNQYPGKVVVSTFHRSKGLEWDKVFLSSVNDYDFPSGDDSDYYRGEPWFLEGRQNPQADMLWELKNIIKGEEHNLDSGYLPHLQARNDIARERLRLLYVGITRAKRSLTITWNSGKRGTADAALALKTLWEATDG